MSDQTRPFGLTLFKVLAVVMALSSLLVIYMPEMPVVGRLFYPFHYRPMIEEQAKAYGLDPLFVVTVIKQESGFRPHVRSQVGARGLMQLMPDTAVWASQRMGLKDFRVDQLEDPATNIKVGCWYLSYLFQQFREPAMVLAAYNGGEGNLSYWRTLQGEQLRHAFPETQGYIAQGMKTYQRYKALYAGDVTRVTARGKRVSKP